MTEMNAEIGNERRRPREQESKPRCFAGAKPPPSLSRTPAPARAGGGGAQPPRKEKRGGGARSAGQGPPGTRLRDPTARLRSWGPPPAPQHVRAGGAPGAPRPSPPLPLPRRLKQRSPGARPGAGGAAHRARVGRAPGAGARRPGPPSPGSARLPGVTGVPVDRVAEAGAPSQRGAEERGPEDSPQQGQQPHRPRGPLWSGPAGPGPLRCRGEKGTKWRWGGGGGAELGVGRRDSPATPPVTFHQWGRAPPPRSEPTPVNPLCAEAHVRLAALPPGRSRGGGTGGAVHRLGDRLGGGRVFRVRARTGRQEAL